MRFIHDNLGTIIIAAVAILAIVDRWRVELWKREMEKKVSREAVPVWQWIQNELIIKALTPRTPRAAELLRLLRDNPQHPLTDADRQELLDGLAIADPNASERDQQLAQVLLPVVMEQVQAEAANPKLITDVQLVGIKK